MKISAKQQERDLFCPAQKNEVYISPTLEQLMRISLLSILFVVATLNLLLASKVKGQEISVEKVTLNLEHESLAKAIKLIEHQTAFRFYYRNADIKGITNLDLSLKTRSVEETLKKVLQNTFLSFRQIEGNILIERLPQDSYQINGKVVGVNHNPIDFATVTIKELKTSKTLQSRVIDTSGYFKLQVSNEGSFLVTVSAIGMDSVTISLTLKEKKVVDLGEIVLSTASNNLSEVAIISRKALIENRVDMTVLNVENSTLAAGNSALEILQKAPGVTLDEKQISLRGKSSVLVLIDGKTTYLSQEQLYTLLSATQASSIKSIEIMTNPSAKYDAAGNAGVINIKMKKNQNFGTNAGVNLSQGYGRYRKTNGGFSLNHKTKAFSFFSNLNYTDNEDYGNTVEERSVTGMTIPTYFNTTFFTKFKYDAYNFKIGTDFNINKQSTIGFIVNGIYLEVLHFKQARILLAQCQEQ